MRFFICEKYLIEAIPRYDDKLEQQYKAADEKSKDQLLDTFISSFGVSGLENLKEVIKRSVNENGMNPLKNPFLQTLGSLKFNPLSKHAENFGHLLDMSNNGRTMSLYQPWMTLKSLYDRSMNDFHYTAYVFDAVSDPSKMKKFFKETEGIDVNDLFVEGSKTDIKPAGSRSTVDDVDTIYGMVNFWENGGENVAEEESSQSSSGKNSEKPSRKGELPIYKSDNEIPTNMEKKGNVVIIGKKVMYSPLGGWQEVKE